MIRTVYRTNAVTSAVTAETLLDDGFGSTGIQNYQAAEGEQIVGIEVSAGTDGTGVGVTSFAVQLRGTAMPETQTFGVGTIGGTLATSGIMTGPSRYYDLSGAAIPLKSGVLEIYGAIGVTDSGAQGISATVFIQTAGGGPVRVGVAPRSSAFM
jgi:hypothetical protein